MSGSKKPSAPNRSAHKQRYRSIRTNGDPDPHVQSVADAILGSKKPWEQWPSEGPRALYAHFVTQAIEDSPLFYGLDDDTFTLVLQAAELAAEVTCEAADVAPTWNGLYTYIRDRVFPAD